MKFCRLVLVAIILTSAHISWAGGEEVAKVDGDIERGNELFHSDLGCHVCHGAEAIGLLGPNIRETVTMDKVYHAIQNFPDMINWEFNNPEIFEDANLTDIVAYLQSLPREP